MIAVDWVHGSTGAYHSAVENVTQLALFISHFINKLLVSSCTVQLNNTYAVRMVQLCIYQPCINSV